MKSIFDHIEDVKRKPHHVRERVALVLAALGTGVVAVIWFVGVFSSGTFAIANTSFAQSTGQEGSSVAAVAPQNTPTNYGVAGAAAALPPQQSNTSSKIQVVDAPAPAAAKSDDATVIPF